MRLIITFIGLMLITSGIYALTIEDKKKLIVAIDIGHTPKKHGSTSARGISEYSFNKKIANLLLTDLINRGYRNSFIINQSGKEIGLKDRTRIAKEKKSNLFISIHHDSVNEKYLKKWKYKGTTQNYSDDFEGHSIFISDKHKENLIIAKIIGQNLLEKGFTPTLHHAEKIKGEKRKLLDEEKGIYQFNQLVVLRTSNVPAILFECGVIVNRLNEKLLSYEEYQIDLTSILSESIDKYFKEHSK